jgi:hypothetical protein
VFKGVNPNALQELASIVDSWLGWTWEESDTESEHSEEDNGIPEEVSVPEEMSPPPPVEEQKPKSESKPQLDLTGVGRAEPEKTSASRAGSSTSSLEAKKAKPPKSLSRSRPSEYGLNTGKQKNPLPDGFGQEPVQGKGKEQNVQVVIVDESEAVEEFGAKIRDEEGVTRKPSGISILPLGYHSFPLHACLPPTPRLLSFVSPPPLSACSFLLPFLSPVPSF